jgi:hypothetical protein
MANQGLMMRDVTPAEHPNPPAWAESFLFRLLEPRSRATVTGDLLEEYREGVLPARGVFRARVWYLRQVVSFVTPSGLMRAVMGSGGEGDMANRLSRASLSWTVAASLALGVIVVFLFLI